VRRAEQLGAAGLVLCAVAVAFAAPELYVPGVSLLLVAVVAPAWVSWAARGIRLRLRAAADVVPEGARVALEVRVRRGRWPLPGATLVLAPRDHTLPLPRRRAGGTIATSVALPHRGRHVVGPVRLTVRDPLGICRRELESGVAEVLVLPQVHPMRAEAAGGLRGGMRRRAFAPQAASEIDSLRPYRPGAPASRIHWATVARTGELVEHHLAADAEQRALIILDARAPQSEDSLDRAVRAAASLCVHLAARGGCSLLLPGDRRSTAIERDLRAWPLAHTRLALVPRAGASDAPTPAAPSRQQAERASMVVYVTAAAPGVTDIPPGCWRLGPHPLARQSVAFSVAGCDAQLVPAVSVARSA